MNSKLKKVESTPEKRVALMNNVARITIFLCERELT